MTTIINGYISYPSLKFLLNSKFSDRGIEENMNYTIETKSLETFLLKHAPGYIEVTPYHWLKQGEPIREIQIFSSLAFLTISVIGNISQLFFIIAFAR